MTDKREVTISEELSKQILEILHTVRQNYSHDSEYKTIEMNLTSVAKVLNNITLKETRGELTPRPPENNLEV